MIRKETQIYTLQEAARVRNPGDMMFTFTVPLSSTVSWISRSRFPVLRRVRHVTVDVLPAGRLKKKGPQEITSTNSMSNNDTNI
jgi:hypothetical protein